MREKYFVRPNVWVPYTTTAKIFMVAMKRPRPRYSNSAHSEDFKNI